jgi:hypothetical protein
VPDEAPGYNSPKRCLARSFRLSRDRWKQKATDRLAAVRSCRVRIRDLTLSRDLWKQKALYYEQTLRDKGLLPAQAPVPDVPAAQAPAEHPAAAPTQPSSGSKKKTRRP